MFRNEKIFFVASMSVLSKVLDEYDLSEIEVIAFNEGIITFCHKVGIKCHVINLTNDLTLKGLYRLKINLDNFAKSIKNKKLYFTFRNNTTWQYYLIKEISKQNEVFFCNLDPVYKEINFNVISVFTDVGCRRILFNKLIYFLVFGIVLSVFRAGAEHYFLGLNDKKLNEFKSFSFESLGKFPQNKKNILSIYNVPKMEILFIDGITQPVNQDILNYIVHYYNKKDIKVFLKPHYWAEVQPALLKKCILLPKELPAEFIKDYPRIVFGFASTSFLAYNECEKIISLIYFVENMHEDFKKVFMTQMMKNVNNIYYPKTIDELKELLS